MLPLDNKSVLIVEDEPIIAFAQILDRLAKPDPAEQGRGHDRRFHL